MSSDHWQEGGVQLATQVLTGGGQRQAQCVTIEIIPAALDMRVEQLLTVNGDGTGGAEMVAGTAMYKVTPPAGETYVLNRVNVYIEEGVNEKFDARFYGATGALTNGIVVTTQNASGTLTDYTPQPVKQIGQWDLLAGIDMFFTDFPAGAADYCAVRWTFSRGGGEVALNGDAGEFFAFEVTDDLGAGGAALVSHLAQVQGYKVTNLP